MKIVTFACLLLVAVGWPDQQARGAKPDVLILTTGGTIASRSDAPLIAGPVLVRAVPALALHANIGVEEFSTIGSSKMTPALWLGLARRINAAFAGADAPDGIVVTHGTDTLEETAYFLNLTVKSERPVVVVGSMRASDELSADGDANLLNAVRVAASDAAAGQGVLVVLNENITAARDAWKSDNRRVDAFRASNVGHIGAVDPDGVRFYHRPLLPHTTATEFDVARLDRLPVVAILTDYTGIDAGRVSHFLELGMDGLVVRTFAGGRMSAGMLAGLSAGGAADLPIVITSRPPGGRIVAAPDYGFAVVVADGQPDNKARILLMLALTRTRNPLEIQRIFDSY